MTTTAHEDQFAPEPVDMVADAERNAVIDEVLTICKDAFIECECPVYISERVRALKTPPHNAVSAIYKYAHLFAAAPELLDSLKNLVADVEQYFSSEEMKLDRARAAIAKAEGKS